MQLLTESQGEKLLANGKNRRRYHLPVMRFFNPCGAVTWLVSMLFEDGDTRFFLADLGLGTPEMGYTSLLEIASLRLPYGLRIERDHYFSTAHLLSIYAEATRAAGLILEFGFELEATDNQRNATARFPPAGVGEQPLLGQGGEGPRGPWNTRIHPDHRRSCFPRNRIRVAVPRQSSDCVGQRHRRGEPRGPAAQGRFLPEPRLRRGQLFDPVRALRRRGASPSPHARDLRRRSHAHRHRPSDLMRGPQAHPKRPRHGHHCMR